MGRDYAKKASPEALHFAEMLVEAHEAAQDTNFREPHARGRFVKHMAAHFEWLLDGKPDLVEDKDSRSPTFGMGIPKPKKGED